MKAIARQVKLRKSDIAINTEESNIKELIELASEYLLVNTSVLLLESLIGNDHYKDRKRDIVLSLIEHSKESSKKAVLDELCKKGFSSLEFFESALEKGLFDNPEFKRYASRCFHNADYGVISKKMNHIRIDYEGIIPKQDLERAAAERVREIKKSGNNGEIVSLFGNFGNLIGYEGAKIALRYALTAEKNDLYDEILRVFASEFDSLFKEAISSPMVNYIKAIELYIKKEKPNYSLIDSVLRRIQDINNNSDKVYSILSELTDKLDVEGMSLKKYSTWLDNFPSVKEKTKSKLFFKFKEFYHPTSKISPDLDSKYKNE